MRYLAVIISVILASPVQAIPRLRSPILRSRLPYLDAMGNQRDYELISLSPHLVKVTSRKGVNVHAEFLRLSHQLIEELVHTSPYCAASRQDLKETGTPFVNTLFIGGIYMGASCFTLGALLMSINSFDKILDPMKPLAPAGMIMAISAALGVLSFGGLVFSSTYEFNTYKMIVLEAYEPNPQSSYYPILKKRIILDHLNIDERNSVYAILRGHPQIQWVKYLRSTETTAAFR